MRALQDRCRERITFGASISPAQADVLSRVVVRMLEAPTAQDLAQQFFDEGGVAVVEIVDAAMAGPDLATVDAHCSWDNGAARVSLRPAYLRRGREVIEQTLPAVLAHELLGHGLWRARADREGVLQALCHHDFEEIHARLVGWLVDIELDGHIAGDGMVRHFLDDPERCWVELKLREPCYALSFSSAEMQDVPVALATRAAAARDKREELTRFLSNSRSWPAVVRHFVYAHGVDDRRVRQLRRQLTQDERILLRQIAGVDAVIAELDLRIEKFRAEADGASERYLRRAAEHPLFARLSQDVAQLTRRLRDRIDQCAHDPLAELPAARRRRQRRWRDQIDFDELKRMYLEDRERYPDHWHDERDATGA